jgi:hypothetical protein
VSLLRVHRAHVVAAHLMPEPTLARMNQHRHLAWVKAEHCRARSEYIVGRVLGEPLDELLERVRAFDAETSKSWPRSRQRSGPSERIELGNKRRRVSLFLPNQAGPRGYSSRPG